MRGKTLREKKIAQIEFGFKIEKIATNENVNYHFVEKENGLFLYFEYAFRYKNRKPHEGIRAAAGVINFLLFSFSTIVLTR